MNCKPRRTMDILLFFIICLFHSAFGFDLSWQIEKKMQMPSAVSSQLICHFNDTIYFIGGRTITNHTFTATNTIYVFDTTNNTFQAIRTTLPTNGAYFASNYICGDTSIYMFGAATNNYASGGQVWIFDIQTRTVTNVSFPSYEDQVSLPCTALNPRTQSIFIVGGITSNHTVSDQVLQFDMTRNTFINASYSAIPKPLYGSMCHVINNSTDAMLLVLGGETEDTSSANIFVYGIDNDQWIKLGLLTEPRSFTRAIYDEDLNCILVIGGGSSSNDSFLNTTDVFYVSNYSVQPAFGDELPNTIEFNTVSQYEDRVFVWGGYGIISQNQSDLMVETRENLNTIFVFDVLQHEKNKTWTYVIVIAGSCCFMLCCGCSAYLLCVKREKINKPSIISHASINYHKYSK
eukprot:1053819_1